ncbi:hypothetical protein K2173_013047 [Erythroxylum novogranatense]|uniref:Uncharacterized protein n=1 Tax=Erythroxylum novogranatense TaxID=1862640 RepID=A0AAV8S6T6_9ROSI|nr:hypothetical protein K2173_013047 [Erythroxylum novogranatense]
MKPSTSMNVGRKITPELVQTVQNLIEICIQLYMTKDEVVETLSERAKIEPGCTITIWERLVKENLVFFAQYYARLEVIRQINLYNEYLKMQSDITEACKSIISSSSLKNQLRPPLVSNPPLGYTNIPQSFFPSSSHHHHPYNASTMPTGYFNVNQPGYSNMPQPVIQQPFHLPANFNFYMSGVRLGTSESAPTNLNHGKQCMAEIVPPTFQYSSTVHTSPQNITVVHNSDVQELQVSDYGTDTFKETLDRVSLPIPWNLSSSDLNPDLVDLGDHGKEADYSNPGTSIAPSPPEIDTDFTTCFQRNVNLFST